MRYDILWHVLGRKVDGVEITDEESEGSGTEGQESISFDSTRDISTSRTQ